VTTSSPKVQCDATALPPKTAACVGAFDGMHRGHAALVARARTHGERVALVTFDPHPARVLHPDRAPRLLQNPMQRQRVASALGIDTLVLLRFDLHMAAMSPAEFARVYLSEGLRPVAVVVGSDFRFGAERSGDAHMLRDLLAAERIAVDVVEPVVGDAGPGKLSSSDIRRAVDEGDVRRAADMLGRWHAVQGTVVEGDRRGRTLGFPTANIDAPGAFMPKTGVYATALAVWDRDAPDYGEVWPSVANVGTSPTFTDDGAPVRLEVHVLDEDLQERLYGADVEVSFVARLRDELKFSNADVLVEQMHRDVELARPYLTDDALRNLVAPP
jgi:riboflavin kinase/FMN adenylyltransferase